MTASADPTVQRLALRLQLKETRNGLGSSQKDVARALGWSVRDFLRVEAVEDGIADGRLHALLDHYGMVEDARDLYAAVQSVRPRNALLHSEVRLLLDYERVASAIYTFEPQLVPGLLQTRAYAEAALGLFFPPQDVGPLADTRVARQDLPDRDGAPDMFFLVDESALRRWAGAAGRGPEIMREQLGHLRRMALNPRVHIRVVPYGAGVHDGLKGGFVILEFADSARCDLLYLEDGIRGDYLGLAEEVHFERFWELEGSAAAERDLDHFLDRALESLDAVPGP